MASPIGTWEINANGYRGQLVISSVGLAGTLSGTVFGDPMVGFWDGTAQKITLERRQSSASTYPSQVYTGFHFDANQPLFSNGGGVHGPAAPFQFRVLTGSFEPGLTREGATKRTSGWMARMEVKTA
jgi:hypothetical protein